MRALRMMVLAIGTGMMAVPLIAWRMGPLEEPRPVAARAASEPSATDSSLVATLGAMMTAAAAAFSPSEKDSAPAAQGSLIPAKGAPVSQGALALACKLASRKTGLAEEDCKAQLGPLATPGALTDMFNGASRAMDAAALPPSAPGAAPAAITPRISVDTGRRARAGDGAKFVKVEK